MEGDERDENKYKENRENTDSKHFHINGSPFFHDSFQF